MNKTTTNNQMIVLTEISKGEGDALVSNPLLLNADAVVIVGESEFKESGVHIIGETEIKKVRQIQTVNSRPVFVLETMAEIAAKLNVTEEDLTAIKDFVDVLAPSSIEV